MSTMIAIVMTLWLSQPPPVIVTPQKPGGMCHVDPGVGLDYRDALLAAPVTSHEVRILSLAMWGCSRRVWRVVDLDDALALLRHEREMGVPHELSGLLLATWCVEAGMRTRSGDGSLIRGDSRNGVDMAHGPFQLWPWQRAWCGLRDGEADDLLVAAWCHWKRVSDRRRERAMECEDSWRVGEALASNGPRYLPYGCAAESGHWREWKGWGL